MSWLKLDDRFDQDPNIVPLDYEQFGMYVYALMYANRNETDGRVPRQILVCRPSLAFEDTPEQTMKQNKLMVRLLCEAKLFASEANGDLLVLHYAQFCDTKEEKDRKRSELSETRAEYGRIGGLRSGQVRREANASKQTKQTFEATKPSPLLSTPSHTDPGERTPKVRSPISTERNTRAHTSPSALTPAPEPAPVAASPAVRTAGKKKAKGQDDPDGHVPSVDELRAFRAMLNGSDADDRTFSAAKLERDEVNQAKIWEQTARARAAGLYDDAEVSGLNVIKIPAKGLLEQRREWASAGLNPDTGEPFEAMNGAAK